MSEQKIATYNHEINILKNVVEKSDGISPRLQSWAGQLIQKIQAELSQEQAGQVSNPLPLPSEPEIANDPDSPDDPMTCDQIRATGLYSEEQIKLMCDTYQVPYAAVPVEQSFGDDGSGD